MTTSTICITITIVLYLAGMLWIGAHYAKKNSSASDFYLGGRKLGPLVTAMSAEASDMSSYLLMGLPGLAYLTGMADVGWTAIGLAAGTYLNWLFTARRLRRYTQITGAYTLPQFFSQRFKDSKSILAAISALIIIVFFIPYTASGFSACGKLFSSLFGVNYMTAMVVSAIVIVGYTAAGGFLAASLTDLVQSIIMTISIFFVLIFATAQAGGFGAVMENAKALPGFLSFSQTHTGSGAAPYGPLTVISTLAWGLGYFGMPHILLRFMAIEDEKKLKVSRRVGSVWVVIAMGLAIFIGFVGNALSAQGAVETLDGSASETIIIRIADLLSTHGILPALMAGLILAGILACTMSTADSQLLAASSSVSQNLLQDTFGMKLSQKTSMLVARLTVVFIAIVGVLIARDPNSSIFGIVSFAWAGFGAGFGPLVICSLFWKRTTFPGAVAGMVAGGVIWGLWHLPLTVSGHNYGTDYLGWPVLGVVAMMIFCTSAGACLYWLSLRCKSILPSALAHGAINAIAAVGNYWLPSDGANFLYGPNPAGLVAGLPLLVLGILAMWDITRMEKTPMAL